MKYYIENKSHKIIIILGLNQGESNPMKTLEFVKEKLSSQHFQKPPHSIFVSKAVSLHAKIKLGEP